VWLEAFNFKRVFNILLQIALFVEYFVCLDDIYSGLPAWCPWGTQRVSSIPMSHHQPAECAQPWGTQRVSSIPMLCTLQTTSKGIGLVEYTLIALLVLVLSIGSARLLGQATSLRFNTVATNLQNGKSPMAVSRGMGSWSVSDWAGGLPSSVPVKDPSLALGWNAPPETGGGMNTIKPPKDRPVAN
jgi:Flp pilus assembly pilin Flp